MKRLIGALLISIFTTAGAEPPVSVSTGNATDFSYHIRYGLQGHGRHTMTLSWPDDTDSTICLAKAEVIASSFDDPLFPAKARYTITREKADSMSTIATGDFECNIGRNPAFSIVLRRTASGCALTLGSDKANTVVPVPFCGDTLRAEAVEGSEILRHTLIIRNIGTKDKAPFETKEELIGHIADSADPMEAVWEYLDRDINTDEARLGGKYTIATVLAPYGYDIIYLSGAENTPGDWEALDIKGKLINTAFEGHYDLEWVDATRHMADPEASATIGIAGEVLELNFPTLRSRLRFRRKAN